MQMKRDGGGVTILAHPSAPDLSSAARRLSRKDEVSRSLSSRKRKTQRKGESGGVSVPNQQMSRSQG